MGKDELLERAADMLGKIGSMKAGIEVCDDAVEKLGGQPVIVIRGDYGEISLDDGDIGLSRKAQADIAGYIMAEIAGRQARIAKTLEGVLDAIDKSLAEETVKCPYPMKPKAFGAVSPDDVDF